MKKLILAALAILFSASFAFAQSPPEGAKPWGQVKVKFGRFNPCEEIVQSLNARLPSYHRELESELNCSVVYSSWFTSYTDRFSGHYGVNLHCEARSFRETQLLSLHRSCLKSPQAACFDEVFLRQVEAIPRTKHRALNRIVCR